MNMCSQTPSKDFIPGTKGGNNFSEDMLWYNLNMKISGYKITIFILLGMIAFAPLSEASSMAVSVPTCPMMQPAQQASCCQTKCDCSIETRQEHFSAIAPFSQMKFELTSQQDFLSTEAVPMKPLKKAHRSAAESPPQSVPIHKKNSTYRL